MYLIKPWNTTFLIHQSLSSMINVDEIQILQFILEGFFLKIDSRKTNENCFHLQPCLSCCTSFFFFFFQVQNGMDALFSKKNSCILYIRSSNYARCCSPIFTAEKFFFFSFKLHIKNKSLARA